MAIPPAHLRRQGIGELLLGSASALRTCCSQLSPPGELLSLELKLDDDSLAPSSDAPYPTHQFQGSLRTTLDATNLFPEFHVEGSVRRLSPCDNAIYWQFAITYEGRKQWLLDGVQVGQERSRMGIVGVWKHATGMDGEGGGPVGPFWWFPR